VLTAIARAQRCGCHAATTGLTAGRKIHSRELQNLTSRQGQSSTGFFVASTAAGFTGLVLLLQDPVSAKSPATRQEVYVWGRQEAIPGGAKGDALRPVKIEWFDQHQYGWEKIALGPSFGAAMDRKGRVYVWGEGTPPEAEEPVFIGPIEATLRGEGKGLRFEDVQCSSTAIYLLRHGRVYMVENVPQAMVSEATQQAASSDPASSSSAGPAMELGSRLVPGLPSPGWFSATSAITKMAIGLEHAAFVTKGGEVYCVGGNSWGQCGVKPEKQKGPMGALEDRDHVEVLTPVRVKFPAAAGPIRHVAVGGRHTLAQDEAGTLYSFGDDRRIQLGLGDTRTLGNDERHSYGVIRSEPVVQQQKKIIARSTGYRYYQPHMQWTPTETLAPLAYNRPEYPPASFFACGEDFTVAVHRDSPDWYSRDQETNVVMACGENSDGQCGRNFQQQQQVWLQARLPKLCRTTHLSCGQGHCLALLASGDLYGWGSNMQGQLGLGSRAPASPPALIKLFEEVAPLSEEVSSKDAAQPASPPALEPSRCTVTTFSCGFRNSAVICEVPSES